MNIITLKLCNNGEKIWLNDTNNQLWTHINGKIINYNYISNSPNDKNDKPIYAENNEIYWMSYNHKKN